MNLCVCVDGVGKVGLHYKSNYKEFLKKSLNKYINFYL